MKCPDCGNEMFLCGTFGAMWNCECGNVVEADEETDKAVRQFNEHYQELLKNMNPADVRLGFALRRYRERCLRSMSDLAINLGMTVAEISNWEMGLESMSKEDVQRYIEAIK